VDTFRRGDKFGLRDDENGRRRFGKKAANVRPGPCAADHKNSRVGICPAFCRQPGPQPLRPGGRHREESLPIILADVAFNVLFELAREVNDMPAGEQPR